MSEKFIRTEWLIGTAALSRLTQSHVAVLGLGGVGSYTVEALARSGLGKLTLIDYDKVSPSNLNRQLIATEATIGQAKTEAAAARIRQINPLCQVVCHEYAWPAEIDEATARSFLPADLDYIVDAIDSTGAKICLARLAARWNLPLISCMGTGNKLDPTQLQIGDIYATSVCPLARIMRRELRKAGIKALKTVYSLEEPRRQITPAPAPGTRKIPPASCSFVPGTAGLLLASAVIRDLIGSYDS